MNWNWPLIGLLGTAAVQLVALTKAYYGLKADNAKVCADLMLAMTTERGERVSGQATVKAELMLILSGVNAAINDLSHRVSTLESGQDEWTKALRQRTHELANDMQGLVIKVDRLERPANYKGEKHGTNE